MGLIRQSMFDSLAPVSLVVRTIIDTFVCVGRNGQKGSQHNPNHGSGYTQGGRVGSFESYSRSCVGGRGLRQRWRALLRVRRAEGR